MTRSTQECHTHWGPNRDPQLPLYPPASRQRQTWHGPSQSEFRMRPALLPPLVIPERPSRHPVLTASHPQRMEQPISYYRPSYLSLPLKPPPRRPGLALDDIDDIDVFNFYNPCLFPPSPATHLAVQESTEPALAELPGYTREPAPCPAPGLHRSAYTASRRGRSCQGRIDGYGTQAVTRSRSCSPPPRYTAEARAPSPLRVPQPRAVSLPQWDASSSIYSNSIHETQGTLTLVSRGETELHEDDHLTPYLGAWPILDDGVSRDRYEEREQAALRELRALIDDFLGPNNTLGGFDANSIASVHGSNMDGLEDGTRGTSTRPGRGGRTSRYGAWWRAFRQGLVLS